MPPSRPALGGRVTLAFVEREGHPIKFNGGEHHGCYQMTKAYTTGKITLTNGSSTVTGSGTAWKIALIAGGVVYTEAPGGNALPIASVDSDIQITASVKWTGNDGTYSYALMRDTSYGAQQVTNANTLAQIIAELRAGTIFKYDASGSIEGRSTYDGRSQGFAYLVSAGVDEPRLFVKASSASGDWSGPFSYATGPTGPAPNLEIGTVAALPAGSDPTASFSGSSPSYALNLGLPAGYQGDKGWTIAPELVADGVRYVLRIASFVGGEGMPPSGVGLYVGSSGLVEDIADAVDIRGDIGPQGNPGVQWRGRWLSTVAYAISDIVADDDSNGNQAVWIAIAANTNERPRDNLSNWTFFPGSFPGSINDGLWGDPVTETYNDGTWA